MDKKNEEKRNSLSSKNLVLIVLGVIILSIIIHFAIIVPNQKKQQEDVNWDWGDSTADCSSIANSHFNETTKQCDCNEGYSVDWATFNCAPN